MVEAKVIDFLEAARDREQTRKRRVVLARKTNINLSHFVKNVLSECQSSGQNVPWLEELDHSLRKALYLGTNDLMTSREINGRLVGLFAGYRFGSQAEYIKVSSALLELDKKSVGAGIVKDPEFKRRIKAAVK